MKANSIKRNTGNLLQEVETNEIVDSLKKELNIIQFGLSFDENYMRTLYFRIDLKNYLDTFEFWYDEAGIKEFSDKDSVLSLKKIDDNWGIFRNRRKKGILF